MALWIALQRSVGRLVGWLDGSGGGGCCVVQHSLNNTNDNENNNNSSSSHLIVGLRLSLLPQTMANSAFFGNATLYSGVLADGFEISAGKEEVIGCNLQEGQLHCYTSGGQETTTTMNIRRIFPLSFLFKFWRQSLINSNSVFVFKIRF